MSDGMYRLLGSDSYKGRYIDFVDKKTTNIPDETGDEIASRVIKNAGLTFEE